jgi:hypothetical protein
MLFMLVGNSGWILDPPSYPLFASLAAGKSKAHGR